MKPYPSYKESGVEWIREIPSGWDLIKPKYNLQKVERVPLQGDDIVTCFRDGVVTLRRNRRTTGFTNSLKEIGYQRIHKGDLVVHEMDGFEGSIGVSDSEGKSTPVYTVIEDSDEYNVRYWMYLLREMSKTGFIESLSRSIRERTTEFRWKMWRELYFGIPPFQEQQQISNYLDHKTQQIDSLIEKTQQKIELLKEQRTSLINHVVTKGLNPDVEMKDSGVEWIGEVPSGWNSVSLRPLLTKVGSGSTPRGGSENYPDHGITFLRSQNIHFDGLRLDKVVYISPETHQKMSGSSVQRNDLLLNITGGSIGRCCVVDLDLEMNVNQHVSIIRTTHKLTSHFLNYVLFSDIGQEQVEYNQTGGNREGLTSDNIKNFRIGLPPIQEQQQIVTYLDNETTKIDTLIKKESQRIDLLKEYRQSLISEVVTGKVDVRDYNG